MHPDHKNSIQIITPTTPATPAAQPLQKLTKINIKHYNRIIKLNYPDSNNKNCKNNPNWTK